MRAPHLEMHLEMLLRDIYHMLGWIVPTDGYMQHHIDAYRERITRELRPRGDSHGEVTQPTAGEVGPHGATR